MTMTQNETVTSDQACEPCKAARIQIVDPMFMVVNGTNLVLCLGHAAEHEERHPGATFAQISTAGALFLAS